VCDNDEVSQWAMSVKATSIRVTSQGLNASLTESIALIKAQSRIDLFLIAHADLPLSEPLDLLIDSLQSDDQESESIIIIPDRHHDGTNVLGIPSSLIDQWIFQYGHGSFAQHVQQAQTTGLTVRVIEDPHLGLDLDTADDLRHPDLINILPRLIPDWNNS
jgi:2-phospho-L-lactate guanylyltransferase (CobY/MobA/RfbA family)